MDEDERAELIAALQQSTVFNEGMLTLNERLLEALSPGANPPDAEEIEYMRAALGRWQEQMAKLRQADGQPDDRAAAADAVRAERALLKAHGFGSGRVQ